MPPSPALRYKRRGKSGDPNPMIREAALMPYPTFQTENVLLLRMLLVQYFWARLFQGALRDLRNKTMRLAGVF